MWLYIVYWTLISGVLVPQTRYDEYGRELESSWDIEKRQEHKQRSFDDRDSAAVFIKRAPLCGSRYSALPFSACVDTIYLDSLYTIYVDSAYRIYVDSTNLDTASQIQIWSGFSTAESVNKWRDRVDTDMRGFKINPLEAEK